MGFLYGIVDFSQNKIPQQDMTCLKKAFIQSDVLMRKALQVPFFL